MKRIILSICLIGTGFAAETEWERSQQMTDADQKKLHEAVDKKLSEYPPGVLEQMANDPTVQYRMALVYFLQLDGKPRADAVSDFGHGFTEMYKLSKSGNTDAQKFIDGLVKHAHVEAQAVLEPK